ncbi:hypothetical protein N7493_007392 [Penicillium malachiteum]|uniref:Uncharacterized protein n=1 Tax=Penicillium malachiteum TaxID=1324776 RepID=A0AAD6MUZ4_9EURO|nr:hypothetical protein N7493_007392 [Penicillium malachiteum]
MTDIAAGIAGPSYTGKHISSEDQAAFLEAVDEGDEKKVSSLLEKGVSTEVLLGWRAKTALALASEEGYTKIVSSLLEKGANKEFRDLVQGHTPLSLTSENGHIDVVTLLLEAGALVDSEDGFDGRTALAWAAENGHIDVVNKLLEFGAPIGARKTWNGQTLLLSAAEKDHTCVVQRLLETGADTEVWMCGTLGRHYYVPQSMAMQDLSPASRTGADTQLRDKIRSQIPLLHAAQYSHLGVAQLLLEKDANTKYEDNFGKTALSCAAENGSKDRQSKTALHLASQNGHEMVVRFLLEIMLIPMFKIKTARQRSYYPPSIAFKTNIELADKSGQTALSHAAATGNDTAMKQLLAKDANVDAQDRNVEYILSWAAREGHHETIQLLISKGAAVHSTNNVGWTPLVKAFRAGHERAVQLLLENGALTDIKDIYDRRPLSWPDGVNFEKNGQTASSSTNPG